MTHNELLELIKAIVRVVVSFVILGIGFYCLRGADQTLQKVGIGFIGTVAGYWLR